MGSKEMTEYEIFQEMISSTLLSGNKIDQNQHTTDDDTYLRTLASNNEALPNINILLNESVSNTILDGLPSSDSQTPPNYHTMGRDVSSFDSSGVLHSKLQGNGSHGNLSENSNLVNETINLSTIQENLDIQQLLLDEQKSVYNLHKRNRKLFLDETLKLIIEGWDKPQILQQMITMLGKDILNSFTLITLLRWLLKKPEPSNIGNGFSPEELRPNTEGRPSFGCPTTFSSSEQTCVDRGQINADLRCTYTDKHDSGIVDDTDESASHQLSSRDGGSTQYDMDRHWHDIRATTDTINWQDVSIDEDSVSNSCSESHQGVVLGEPAETAKNPKVFSCTENQCGESFTSKQRLNLHQLKRHNIGILFNCEECEFKTPRRKDFHGHLVSQHHKLMPGLRIYQCKFCEYKCVDKLRLDEHEATHTGLKKYSCIDCGKFYTTKRGLRTHIKFHGTARPFKCNLCEADFKVKSKLTDHLRLVHFKKGEKPFQCGYCQHRASIRGNVNQHIRKIHKDKPVIVLVSDEKRPRQGKNYNYSGVNGNRVKKASSLCSLAVSKV